MGLTTLEGKVNILGPSGIKEGAIKENKIPKNQVFLYVNGVDVLIVYMLQYHVYMARNCVTQKCC